MYSHKRINNNSKKCKMILILMMTSPNNSMLTEWLSLKIMLKRSSMEKFMRFQEMNM